MKIVNFNLFWIGKLQFNFDECMFDSEKYEIKKGDKVIAIHIPRGESLKYDEVIKSYAMIKMFLFDYFPEFKYK